MKTINIAIGNRVTSSLKSTLDLSADSKKDALVKDIVTFDGIIDTWISFIPNTYAVLENRSYPDKFKYSITIKKGEDIVSIFISWACDNSNNKPGILIDSVYFDDYVESLFSFQDMLS